MPDALDPFIAVEMKARSMGGTETSRFTEHGSAIRVYGFPSDDAAELFLRSIKDSQFLAHLEATKVSGTSTLFMVAVMVGPT